MRKLVCLLVILGSIVSGAAWGEGSAADARFPEERDAIRRGVIERRGPDIIAPGPGDQARDLVDTYLLWNLAGMEERGLMAAELAVSPWTDSYWPTYAGGIAHRYGDPRYQPSLKWGMNERYLSGVIGRGADTELSPAEKYDLLVGDPDFSLTRQMLRGASGHVRSDGTIESWFGLCHGWAAASFMLPRPEKAITVRAADGRELRFTPSDIKALGTLLWANARASTRFVGGRCNEKDPGRDADYREINPECFDSNPATWHLAVVNQLGIAKRSMVMDADAGYEVWNQPVYSYSYEYVNPVTGKVGRSLESAKVARRDYKDPWNQRRSRSAESIVNVVMTVTYVVERDPSLALVDGPEYDAHSTVIYSYDLELDARNNIVGGEWHTQQHPDFLWVPVAGTRALSVGDQWLARVGDRSEWKVGEAVPAAWREAAKAAVPYEQPLARIVEALFERARR